MLSKVDNGADYQSDVIPMDDGSISDSGDKLITADKKLILSTINRMAALIKKQIVSTINWMAALWHPVKMW